MENRNPAQEPQSGPPNHDNDLSEEDAEADGDEYTRDDIKGAHERENPEEYQRRPPPVDFSKWLTTCTTQAPVPDADANTELYSGSRFTFKRQRRRYTRTKRAMAQAKKKALAEATSASPPLPQEGPAVAAQSIKNFKAKTRTSLAGFLKVRTLDPLLPRAPSVV